MPFKFTGDLKKLVVVLQPKKLSEEEQKRLHEELAKAMMAKAMASARSAGSAGVSFSSWSGMATG
jgi:hypothetical protein